MGVDGQGIGQQQYFSSSGYHQPPVSYGSEALPCYSWDPTFVRDIPKGVNGCFQNSKPGLRSSGLAKSNALNSTKTNGGIASKFSKPLLQSQPVKSLNKVCIAFPPTLYLFDNLIIPLVFLVHWITSCIYYFLRVFLIERNYILCLFIILNSAIKLCGT